jgi:hypothetical protein
VSFLFAARNHAAMPKLSPPERPFLCPVPLVQLVPSRRCVGAVSAPSQRALEPLWSAMQSQAGVAMGHFGPVRAGPLEVSAQWLINPFSNFE